MAKDSTISFSDGFNSLKFLELIKNPTFLVLFLMIAGITLVLIPLPGFLLDFFMILNIVLSLIIIITVVSSKNNLDFSVFPTVLLLTTSFRLIINISSTRLILADGVAFDGNVVKAFAEFVTGGSYFIGVVIFIIIIAVQYLVITKGSNRASEVSARFKLDSLPGKQIAIDADLNSGLIDEKEAIHRRETVQKEADFYGSMDGASKFISGEVIASIVIVVVNIIGGIVIGVLIRSEGIGVASESYIKFAIGDGLVAAIPSLIVSISTGIVVTRSISENNLSDELYIQIFKNPMAFYLIGVFVLVTGVLPGFPSLVFFPLSILFFFIGYNMQKKITENIEDEKIAEIKETTTEEDLSPEKIIEGLQYDPLEIELGYELIYVADKSQGGDLLDRIKKSRKQLALELGLVIPQVRITDNLQLEGSEYHIKINGATVGQGVTELEKLLAINTTGKEIKMPSPEVKDPVFNLPAFWIEEKDKIFAEKKGFTIVDIPTIVTTHLIQIIKENANEILSRKDTQMILENSKKSNPILLDELKNYKIKTGDIQHILGELLVEEISIRNIDVILETIIDNLRDDSLSFDEITEKVRQRLKRQISHQIADSQKNINFFILDQEWENYFYKSLKRVEKTSHIDIKPDRLSELIEKVGKTINLIGEKGYKPILLVDGYLRKSLKVILHKSFKDLKVVAKEEIAEGYKLHLLHKIDFKD